MSSEATQGAIISNVRSELYPEIKCMGIVISARCDLANCKVESVCYLIAMPLEIWLNKIFMRKILEDDYQEKERNFKKWLASKGYEYDVVKTYNDDELNNVCRLSSLKEREKINL